MYSKTVENEKNSKATLIRFEENYPGVTTQDNVNDILRTLKQKQKNDAAERLGLSETETAQEE